MFDRLFARRRRNESIAYSLYGTIVAQAREPALYREMAVPDTVDGRFDMIVLHASLLFSRLKRESDADRQLGQAVFDAFLKDMDRNLREMGVSDIGVPKKLKKMAEAFYGRLAAYDAALESADGAALPAAIARNVFPDGGGKVVPDGDGKASAEQIALYVRRAAAMLASQPVAMLLAGEIAFPPVLTAVEAV